MTNPTRQEIIDAHRALESLYNAVRGGISEFALRSDALAVLAALPPKPRPTMAEVEWDEKAHQLAKAEHEIYGPVTMIKPASLGSILCVLPSEDGGEAFYATPAKLTPTGKRYTLTEVQDD